MSFSSKNSKFPPACFDFRLWRTMCFIYYRKYILHIPQPSQYRCTQLQYWFAVISEAPSICFVCHAYLYFSYFVCLLFCLPVCNFACLSACLHLSLSLSINLSLFDWQFVLVFVKSVRLGRIICIKNRSYFLHLQTKLFFLPFSYKLFSSLYFKKNINYIQ